MQIKTTLTTAKRSKPDENALGFGKYFTDHMFVMPYSRDKGWHNPEILPYGPLALDPAAMVLHYAQAVFEGMKCYHAEDGRLLLFRPEKNFARLNRSNERLCIPPLDEKFILDALIELLKVDKDWVPKSPGTSLYIRPFVIATEAAVGVHPSHNYMFIIILSPVGAYFPEGLNPVKICIEEEYVRATRGGIGYAKAAANYAASLKGQEKAQKSGYTQVLWLDGVERKYVQEVGTMNVFFQIDGKLVTPELEDSVLPGVTRDSVIGLLKSWGYTVEERKLSVDELLDAHRNNLLQEAFGTGTAAVISPIGVVSLKGEHYVITEKTGPLAQRLYDELTGIQYGRIADSLNWVVEV